MAGRKRTFSRRKGFRRNYKFRRGGRKRYGGTRRSFKKAFRAIRKINNSIELKYVNATLVNVVIDNVGAFYSPIIPQGITRGQRIGSRLLLLKTKVRALVVMPAVANLPQDIIRITGGMRKVGGNNSTITTATINSELWEVVDGLYSSYASSFRYGQGFRDHIVKFDKMKQLQWGYEAITGGYKQDKGVWFVQFTVRWNKQINFLDSDTLGVNYETYMPYIIWNAHASSGLPAANKPSILTAHLKTYYKDA